MATTVEDANRMIEASRKSGKLLYIGFQKRLVPLTVKMKELVAAGEIGKIEFVSGNLFRGDWNPRSWKYTNPKTGVATNWRYLTFTEGSALLEDGVHEIDSLNWMIDDRVVRVTAAGGNNVYKDRETVDHVATIIEYASGVKLSFELCLFAPNAGPAARRMVLIGSEGMMYPENGKVAIRKRDGKGGALRGRRGRHAQVGYRERRGIGPGFGNLQAVPAVRAESCEKAKRLWSVRIPQKRRSRSSCSPRSRCASIV